MTVAVVSVAVMAAMLFLLGLNVSLVRGKTNVIAGVEDDPTSAVNKAVRAHGNNAEWVPILAVLSLYLGMNEPAMWVEIVIALCAASRVVAAIGFITCKSLDQINPLKAIGAMTTYVGGLALAVAAALTVL